MKNILPALFILTCCLSTYAQKDMIPGYVVRNSNDTLRGFIRERMDWSPPFIDFARNAEGETIRISIETMSMFYLKTYDSYFYRMVVGIDTKSRETEKLESGPGRHIVTDTVLLRLVVRGVINLYQYKDESAKQHFFVQKKGEKIQELDYVRYKSGIRYVEMPFYVETLRAMTATCDKVKMAGMRYDEKSFAKVIAQYNSCFSSESYAAEAVGNKIRLGISAGVGSTSMSFHGDDLKNAQDANASNSKSRQRTAFWLA